MSFNPDFDAEVARNIRSKNASPGAPKPSRIEDYAAQIAELVRREQELDDLHDKLVVIHGGEDEITPGHPAALPIARFKSESAQLASRKVALEDAVSWEAPETAREAFLLMLLVGGRTANAGQEEREAVDRLIYHITLFLEGLSGTTAEALGLGGFIVRPDIEELEERAKDLLEAAAQPHAEAAS